MLLIVHYKKNNIRSILKGLFPSQDDHLCFKMYILFTDWYDGCHAFRFQDHERTRKLHKTDSTSTTGIYLIHSIVVDYIVYIMEIATYLFRSRFSHHHLIFFIPGCLEQLPKASH